MVKHRRAGFTLIELLIVVAVIGILAALATPRLLRAKISANEASAIGSLRAINSAEANFAATCAPGTYNLNLPQLVAGRYLSPDMGFNPKAGYNFTLQAGLGSVAGPADCTGAATVSAYYLSGRRVAASTGNRGFASNSAGTLWQDLSGVPPAEPFAVAGTVATLQ